MCNRQTREAGEGLNDHRVDLFDAPICFSLTTRPFWFLLLSLSGLHYSPFLVCTTLPFWSILLALAGLYYSPLLVSTTLALAGPYRSLNTRPRHIPSLYTRLEVPIRCCILLAIACILYFRF